MIRKFCTLESTLYKGKVLVAQNERVLNLTTSLEGICCVFGAAFPMNLFIRRILAKVPRAITQSLPRREPYELNSLGFNLWRQCFTQHKNIYSPTLKKITYAGCIVFNLEVNNREIYTFKHKTTIMNSATTVLILQFHTI